MIHRLWRGIVGVLILAVFPLTVLEASVPLIYFSDKENPPSSAREPPFEGTRLKISKPYGYLLIRYPYQKPILGLPVSDCAPLKLKFSIGNELYRDFSFVVENVEMKIGARSLDWAAMLREDEPQNLLTPEELKKQKIIAHPSVFGDLNIISRDCVDPNTQMTLDLAVRVFYEDKEDLAHHQLTLYSGIYLSERRE